MRNNYKKYPDISFDYESREPLLSSSSSSSSDSPHVDPSSSLLVPVPLVPSPVFTIDEIVSCIVTHLQQAQLHNLTHWDNFNRSLLKKTITDIHNRNDKEYLKEFTTLKIYDDYGQSDYNMACGVFKHKYFNFIFRIDNVDNQISSEDDVTSIFLRKYNNSYQDIIRLGLVLPMYCHIKITSPPLYYSVQPYISTGITLDAWIKTIKHRNNFDELVYDVFMQLAGILGELHEVECVHGDLKPSNILVVENAFEDTRHVCNVCVFLIDFGLSGIHQKTKCATGGTLPYCAPETENTNANKRFSNNAILRPHDFEYNWLKHNKLHDIWSLGIIIATIYILKDLNHFYRDYPSDFFLSTGYVSPKYLNMINHDYIRQILSENILVEPSKRCDTLKLNDLISKLVFM
jgi:serine/threonine protein kinase